MARWLATDPKVLLLNDPTRGVDIGAKRDLYDLLLDLAGQGVAVVMLSTEVDEHVELMDRVLVFREGAISKELTRDELSAPVRSWAPSLAEQLRPAALAVRRAAGDRTADRQHRRRAELRQAGELAGRAGDAGAVRDRRDGVDAGDPLRRRRPGHLDRPARRSWPT